MKFPFPPLTVAEMSSPSTFNRSSNGRLTVIDGGKKVSNVVPLKSPPAPKLRTVKPSPPPPVVSGGFRLGQGLAGVNGALAVRDLWEIGESLLPDGPIRDASRRARNPWEIPRELYDRFRPSPPTFSSSQDPRSGTAPSPLNQSIIDQARARGFGSFATVRWQPAYTNSSWNTPSDDPPITLIFGPPSFAGQSIQVQSLASWVPFYNHKGLIHSPIIDPNVVWVNPKTGILGDETDPYRRGVIPIVSPGDVVTWQSLPTTAPDPPPGLQPYPMPGFIDVSPPPILIPGPTGRPVAPPIPGRNPGTRPDKLPTPDRGPNIPPQGIPGSRPGGKPGTQPGQPGSDPLGEPGFNPSIPPFAAPLPIPMRSPTNIPRGAPEGLKRPVPQTGGQPPNPTCSSDSCMTASLNNQRSLMDKLDNAANLASLTASLANLAMIPVINAKLGDQVQGGISGKLQRFAQWSRIGQVLNWLTLFTALHNAAMISGNLAQTLTDLTSQTLYAIGIKDDEEQAIDINSILGKQVDSLIVSIIGQEAWTGTKIAWNKANRIISTASNIIWSVRSIMDSAQQIAEWSAENTGKIGNALKKWRIVGENAYPWMPERVTSQTVWQKKVGRIVDGLEVAEDAASSLSGVTSEVISIQDEVAQLKQTRDEFKAAVASVEPLIRPDNNPVKAVVDAGKQASQSPDVLPIDLIKFEE